MDSKSKACERILKESLKGLFPEPSEGLGGSNMAESREKCEGEDKVLKGLGLAYEAGFVAGTCSTLAGFLGE